MPALATGEDGAAVASASDARGVARLLPLDPGLYGFRLAAAIAPSASASGFALPVVQICQAPRGDGSIEITDTSGRAASWLGRSAMLLVSVPPSGGTALITAYLADAPVELAIYRLDEGSPAPRAEWLRLILAPAASSAPSAGAVGFDAVAHIRGRGDVRFADTPWVGRIGTGAWIEALTLVSRDPSAGAVIEYKGLIGDGTETSWIGCGAPCGTQGRGLPLIGLAVRQKAGSANALFDCEYSGYFQSGATTGPVRNGAPCRSTIDGDPLEGLQLRITRRPPPPASQRARR